MKWKRKERPVAAVCQLRSADVHPFGALRGFTPLGTGEEQVYRQLREAVPVLDAAVGKLVRLTGGFTVKCADPVAEQKLRAFLQNVPCGRGQSGVDGFLSGYLDSLLTYGRAIGEMVVAGFLRGMGYECVQEHCQYDGKSDRFFVRILATWNDVQADAPYTVTVGENLMRYTTSFQAEQKINVEDWDGRDGENSASAPWTLTLEEMIPRDVEEPEDVAVPFVLTVSRGTVEESYSNCCWSSYNRLDTQEGLRKVRTVLALKRNVKKLG